MPLVTAYAGTSASSALDGPVGGTEAINGIIEKARQLAHGFKTFTHYRVGILLAASGARTYRRGHAHA